MGCVKRKSAFEHVQNVPIQIILRMRKVSLGIFSMFIRMILLAKSEGADQIARMRRYAGLSALTVHIFPMHRFRMARPKIWYDYVYFKDIVKLMFIQQT